MESFVELYSANAALRSLYAAVFASMEKVAQGQWRDRLSTEKSDGTLVTAIDLESEAAAMLYLQEIGLDIWPEEVGHSGDFKTDEVILYDPLDGTAPFTNGAMSSTVSAAIYDHKRKVVTACVVGEPVSGRVWCAVSGSGVWRMDSRHCFVDDVLKSALVRKVSASVMSPKSTVYLDLSPGFKKGNGYPDIPSEVWGQFFPKVFSCSRVNMFGTNCGHHALVANGDEGAVGAVTTALGGPWDVAPVMLVLEAGGQARAFSTKDGQLTEVSPLAVSDYNLVEQCGHCKSVV